MLSEVRRDAVARLNLREGAAVFALITSVSLDVRGPAGVGAPEDGR